MVRQPGYGPIISNSPQGSKSATVGLGNSYRAICNTMVISPIKYSLFLILHFCEIVLTLSMLYVNFLFPLNEVYLCRYH